MSKTPDDLVRGVETVASVKQIYDRLLEVMEHPLSSAADIGRVIGEDPGLTARLLRLVNSPIYGFPKRISEVMQAVSVVGMVQLHDLALGTTFIHLFENVPCRPKIESLHFAVLIDRFEVGRQFELELVV